MSQPSPLDEVDCYVLFTEDKDVFLFDKDTNKNIWRVTVDEKVSLGLIGLNQDWVIVIGNGFLIVWVNNKLHEIKDSDLIKIHSIKHISDYEVEVLADSKLNKPVSWRFNILTKNKTKVSHSS